MKYLFSILITSVLFVGCSSAPKEDSTPAAPQETAQEIKHETDAVQSYQTEEAPPPEEAKPVKKSKKGKGKKAKKGKSARG